MTDRFPWHLTVLLMLALLAGTAGGQTSAPTEANLQALIHQLDAPRLAERQAAATKIRALGPAALPALREARPQASTELARQADRLIRELEGLMLFGAEVTLSADRTSLRWDQSLSITVTLRNPNPWPIRSLLLPPPLQTISDLAEQTGRLFDVLDYLQVTDPAGQPVEPHLDHMLDEWELREELSRRVEEQPTAAIPPGESVRVDLPAINRGSMTRLRMLEKGTYRIQFRCDQPWEDPVLVAAGVGRVVSNTLKIKFIESAPQVVRQSTTPVALRLSVEDGALVCRLQSTYDVPFHVNTNVGRDSLFVARLTLHAEQNGQSARLNEEALCGGGELAIERFRPLAPCQHLELFRVNWAALSRQGELATFRRGAPCRVHVTYRNLCSRATLEHRLDGTTFARLSPAQRAITEGLPQRVYVGTVTSPPIDLKVPPP